MESLLKIIKFIAIQSFIGLDPIQAEFLQNLTWYQVIYFLNPFKDS